MFKVGDKVVVDGMPPGIFWISPTGKHDLKNGDVLTLVESIEQGSPYRRYKNEERVVFKTVYKNCSLIEYTIPTKWIKLYDMECSCEIVVLMRYGCKCGSFALENKS